MSLSREDLYAAADNLANLCNELREQMRKMQTVIDLQDSELRELRAARATWNNQAERMAQLERQLADKRIPWVAAMAAELVGKAKVGDDGHYLTDAKGVWMMFTLAEAQQQAIEIYSFMENHFGTKEK